MGCVSDESLLDLFTGRSFGRAVLRLAIAIALGFPVTLTILFVVIFVGSLTGSVVFSTLMTGWEVRGDIFCGFFVALDFFRLFWQQ